MKNSCWYVCILIICVSCSSSNDDESPILIVSDFTFDMNELEGYKEYNFPELKIETNQTNLNYSIVSQQPSGALEIDPTTGKLTIGNSVFFDYEFFKEITATVLISNELISEQINVTLNIQDREERGSYLKYNNEVYAFGGLRELRSNYNFNLTFITGDVRFYNNSGVRGKGNLIAFRFDASKINIYGEVVEGEFVVDENVQEMKDLFLMIDVDFDAAVNYVTKPIKSGKIIFKRQDTDTYIPGNLFFDKKEYEIHFMIFLEDCSIVSGNYDGIGLSSK